MIALFSSSGAAWYTRRRFQKYQRPAPVDMYSLTYDLRTRWTIPLYSCATAVKASIKTVRFKLNATNLLNLGIQAINHNVLWEADIAQMMISLNAH